MEFHCNLRQVSGFSRPMVKSVYHGTESILYLGPKIWGIPPEKQHSAFEKGD